MKTDKKLVDLEKAKAGEKSDVSGQEIFVYDLYKKTLAHIVRLDCELEKVRKDIEKLLGGK